MLSSRAFVTSNKLGVISSLQGTESRSCWYVD